ncbi:MAG: hypothetical protein Q9196_006549 [Gyalolechia fulgens]
MASILPEELLPSLSEAIKCRELQIQQLACLTASNFPSPPNLVLHGTEATGKSLTVNALLKAIDHKSAIIRSKECITTRHLLERTLTQAQNALGDGARPIDGRCESISTFVVQLQRLLEGQKKFILVFDNIDRQREAAPTLLPALARLTEIIPNLTTIFIITYPRPHLFHKPGIPHIHFPPYTRAELLSLVSSSPLPLEAPSTSYSTPPTNTPTFSEADLNFLYPRFATAVHDSLAQPASNTLPSLHRLLTRLWPPFIAPILSNQYSPREFSKLMVRNRYLFQSEDALKENIVRPPPTQPPSLKTSIKQTLQLPTIPAQLLVTAFLVSHNAPKNDTLLFSKYSTSRRKRRGGGAVAQRTPRKQNRNAQRKITRRMLGAQVFGLERLLAVYAALFRFVEDDMDSRRGNGVAGGGRAEILTQFATLVGMRLVIRTGAGGGGRGDPLEVGGGKWKVNVGMGYVRQMARGLKFDLENYLLE